MEHEIRMAAAWGEWRRRVEAELRGLGLSAAEARAEADRAWARIKARRDWLRAQFDEMKRLDQALMDYWGRFEDENPEIDLDDPDLDLPQPPEQKALEAIEEALAAVREHDRWPRHLHWSDV